jgi:hypothetical protein
VLTELSPPDRWFAVPGRYGGCHYVLEGQARLVAGRPQGVGGSGERRRITAAGAVPTGSGSSNQRGCEPAEALS